MFCSIAPKAPHEPRAFSALLLLAATLGIALLFVSAVGAQQGAAHPAATPHHPAVIAGAYRTPAPVRTTPPQMMRIGTQQPRSGWATHPHFLVAASSAGVIGERAVLLDRDLLAGFAAPRFLRPFFLGEPFFGEFGVAGSVSQFGGLPLGFGLWPACDSPSIPGVFWTVGPCFGVGSYPAEFASAATPAPYVPPLILFSPPPSGATAQPQQPSPSPAVTLYMTDGSTVVAQDWWIAQGRLQYITESGQTGAVDVLKLDIDRTIKENQKRGLEFRLKFTAPSDAYPPSIRP